MILVLLWHGDLDVDGVRADIVADNAVMRFNVTILVDGGRDVIVLVLGLGQQHRRHCSDMMLVVFGKMNGVTYFFDRI